MTSTITDEGENIPLVAVTAATTFLAAVFPGSIVPLFSVRMLLLSTSFNVVSFTPYTLCVPGWETSLEE